MLDVVLHHQFRQFRDGAQYGEIGPAGPLRFILHVTDRLNPRPAHDVKSSDSPPSEPARSHNESMTLVHAACTELPHRSPTDTPGSNDAEERADTEHHHDSTGFIQCLASETGRHDE